MKIAFDYQVFGMQPYGGISRYYAILADEIIKRGESVNVFAALHRNNYLEDLPSKNVRGVKFNYYPPKTARIFRWVNHAICQVQMKGWRPDIIHETYYSPYPQLKNNAVRVTSAYDMIHELFSEQFPKNDKTTEWKKATFSRVQHILSISESTKRDLIELFDIPEDKISVVHLGVDLSAFRFPFTDVSSNRRPYLLYVGGRDGYKNFSGFIKAFASSIQLRSEFNVIAFGGSKLTSHEMELFNRFGLSANQVLQVSGSDDDLAKLYANAVALVYPSLYEGFGLPPLEAMAAGCPVVCSNTSSIPEVVNQAGEYFDPNDLEDIRIAIERVAYSQERRAEVVRLGYENIKNYSWGKCAQKTIDVYKKVIESL